LTEGILVSRSLMRRAPATMPGAIERFPLAKMFFVKMFLKLFWLRVG
jgi:hypothetical protein